MSNLAAPRADAAALASVLADPQIGEFDVHVVMNEPAHVIKVQIEELLAEGRPEDLLVLHFSGHGLKNDSGELFFAATQTRPNRLGSTAVPADFIQRCMRSSRARSVVLLLDCCYGGAFSQGVSVRGAGSANVLDSFPVERLGGGKGRAVITASNSFEFAFEGNSLAEGSPVEPSVFTQAVVEGLQTGEADRNEDGWVSLDELYDFVFDRVRERSPNQTPTRDIEMQGELLLARSGRRRIDPTPIPADIESALRDSSIYARVGAVAELRARLLGNNVAAAVGACHALVSLVENDIKYVADVAQSALDEAVIHPEPPIIDLGELEQGGSGSLQLRFLGPAIARACVPAAGASWLKVQAGVDGFIVSIDTSNPGDLSSDLTFKGPMGQIIIPVVARVLPPGRPGQSRPPRRKAGRLPVELKPEKPKDTSGSHPPKGRWRNMRHGNPGGGAARESSRTGARPYGASVQWLLLVGLVLMVVGTLPSYYFEGSARLWQIENYKNYCLAFGIVVCAILVFGTISRSRFFDGAVVGVACAAGAGLLMMLELSFYDNNIGEGRWKVDAWGWGKVLELVAHLIIIVAGVVVLENRQVRWVSGVVKSKGWVVCGVVALVVGAVGAIAIFNHHSEVFRANGTSLVLLAGIWLALIAIAVPLTGVLVEPPTSVGIVLGWCFAAACYPAIFDFYLVPTATNARSLLVFTVTLGVLVLLAISIWLISRSEGRRHKGS